MSISVLSGSPLVATPVYNKMLYKVSGSGVVSSTTIQGYMDALAVQLVRGTDKPDLIVADNNYYRFYLQSLQAIQRITESGSGLAGAGFASLKYYGAGMASDVVAPVAMWNRRTPAPEGKAWRTVPVEPTEAMIEAANALSGPGTGVNYVQLDPEDF